MTSATLRRLAGMSGMISGLLTVLFWMLHPAAGDPHAERGAAYWEAVQSGRFVAVNGMFLLIILTLLVLVDVYGFTYREAARMSEVSEAILRHRLSSARGSMQERFHGLCALVNKQGACYQCNVLREAAPEARRGVPVQPLPGASPEAQLEARFEVVRRADLDGGTSHRLHDVIFRLVNRMVEQGVGLGRR